MSAGAASLKVGWMLSVAVIIWVATVVFPQASVNVQVLVVTNELGQFPATVESTPATVMICWLQLSVAESEIMAGTSTLHPIFMLAGAVSVSTGPIVSFTFIVCDTDDVFPQASAKVQVRVMTNELAHCPATVESTPVTVIESLQLSVAVNETIAGTRSAQETVTSAGAVGATGATVSFTLIVCDTDDVFPQASAKVHVRVMTNELAHCPATVESTPVTVIESLQLSVAVNETIAGTSSAQDTVTSAGAVGATGATVSFTLIVCDTDEVFPQASAKVQVRVTVNASAQAPGVTVSTPVTVTAPEQLSVAVNETIAGTSSAHVTVTVAGASGATGAVIS
jgi:predicted metallopeptidase